LGADFFLAADFFFLGAVFFLATFLVTFLVFLAASASL
jgi:hypothetical protein